MPDRPRTELKLDYRPYKHTQNGHIVDYLKNQSENTELRQTIFKILEVWTSPLALKEVEGVDLEAKSWASIQELIRQGWLIATTNDLDRSKLVSLIRGTLEALEPGCTAAIAPPIVQQQGNYSPPPKQEVNSLDKELEDEEIDELKGFSA
jgi:hypothetical protein